MPGVRGQILPSSWPGPAHELAQVRRSEGWSEGVFNTLLDGAHGRTETGDGHMTSEEAMAFIAENGVVLESARGPVPSLAEAIVGEPIGGSWWGHPLSHTIYAIISAVREDPAILVCRLVGGRVTHIHKRLWPALARLAPELADWRIAAVREEHTPSGAHQLIEVPFCDWVPATATDSAAKLSRQDAIDQIGPWVVPLLGATDEPRRRVRDHRP